MRQGMVDEMYIFFTGAKSMQSKGHFVNENAEILFFAGELYLRNDETIFLHRLLTFWSVEMAS